MPLTPEDVANKQFTSTRLKPGYDETEVDEFLDEVEAELTRLYRENDELRSRLAAAGRQPAESAPAAAPAAVPDPAVVRENEELRSKMQAMQRQLAEAQERGRAATTQQMAPPPQPAAPQTGAASETATGILALAQRTADEHIAEARTQADRIIGEARTRADQLKREAEDKHRQTIGSLETERSGLERKVEQLRAFEREYRGRLKSYLEGQLRELEGRGTEAPAGSPGGPPGGASGGQQGAPQQGQSGQPARSPFSPGAPVGSDVPSGPPQQPGSGFALEDGSDQRQ